MAPHFQKKSMAFWKIEILKEKNQEIAFLCRIWRCQAVYLLKLRIDKDGTILNHNDVSYGPEDLYLQIKRKSRERNCIKVKICWVSTSYDQIIENNPMLYSEINIEDFVRKKQV